MSWATEINWETQAGRTLLLLFRALPPGREYRVTLFGSSPLQLVLDPTFLSGDVDMFGDAFYDDLFVVLAETGLADREKDFHIQLCREGNFRTSPKWRERAYTTRVENVLLTLPHPIDILIAKLHRLADKDLAAFRLVIGRTGHPTEEEMRRELQDAVDLYRPNFDEEVTGDITTNTRVLWNEIWDKDINVRQEIIAPALARLREGYAPDIPRIDYKADLRRLGESGQS